MVLSGMNEHGKTRVSLIHENLQTVYGEVIISCHMQLVRVFPESPDWLKEKGRYEEVGRIFEVIAQANGRELTPEYIINMKRRFRIEKSMQEERKRNGTETRYSVWDLFRGSNTCKKSTAIIFIWFTSTTASVGLSLYSFELEGDLYLNFFVSAGAEMAAAAMVVVAVGWCGRRCSFCLGSALGGALTLSIAIIQAATRVFLAMEHVILNHGQVMWTIPELAPSSPS
ncbi:uncharacterized protein TNCV_120151 [Trichonephila clavipes]|nr:uncharacterized protein TNCV_120151 [Trichonephila clavipes]